MAKAKFPGKPSKTSQITRLRFSSRNVNLTCDPSRVTAKQLASGLLFFNETFGITDEEEDLYGFEKIGNVFQPCHSLKQIKQLQQNNATEETSKKTEQNDGVPVSNIKCFVASTEACNIGTSKNLEVKKNPCSESCETETDSKFEWKFKNDKIKRTTMNSHNSLLNGVGGNESRLVKKLLDKAKSPKKFVLPSVSVHSSRPIIPNKRFLEDIVSLRRRQQREVQELLNKPHPRKMPKSIQNPKSSEIDCTGKERMKREIERYTDIMTTEVADQKQKGDELQKNIGLKSDKEGKLREKIQQLLRSQWESRLQFVDGKSDCGSTKKESPEVQDSASSLSSEDEQTACKTRRIPSSREHRNNAMKSKIILRKARLRLNQKLLKQLRQPSRLQQLVGQKTCAEEPAKTSDTSKPAILRPAQLIIQNSMSPLRTPSPAPSTLKEIPDSLPLPSPALLNCRLSSFQPTGEVGVSNPLGCAFVMEPSDTKGLPGTVVCGVCGAVRRYSFILQARKFGTFSCEPCRKFISRVLRARVPVKCSSGTGRCIHPPVLRWNSACPPEDKPLGGEVMTTRCKACWLKLALTGFRMRESDHDDLRRLLPKEMQELVPTASNRLENLPWAPNRGQVIRMRNNSATNVPQPASSSLTVTAAEAVLQQELRIENHDPSMGEATVSSSSKTSKADHCAGSRTRKKSGSSQNVESRRSSLEIKGPRVKNVCRSAMLALGQPRAKFLNEESDNSQPVKYPDGTCACCLPSDSSSPVPATSECSPRQLTKRACAGTNTLNNSARLQATNRSSDRKNFVGSPARPLTIYQGERIPVTCPDTNRDLQCVQNRIGFFTPAAQAWHQQESSKNNHKTQKIMNISTKAADGRKLKAVDDRLLVNFWERFDADRIWKQGFAVIGSKLPPCPPCYLCGSAGRDELLYCSTCCNPFHLYCVADSSRGALRTNSVEPLCCHWKKTTISEKGLSDPVRFCNLMERDQRSTEKDYRFPLNSSSAYSHSSLSNDPISTKKSLGLLEPFRCQSCGNICGNKEFCSTCAASREQVSVGLDYVLRNEKRLVAWSCLKCKIVEMCPVCEKEHNWSKNEHRLNCTCCQAWIHAHCEKLPDEEYHFLSMMTSIKYICHLCSSEQKWLEILRQQLQISYAKIVQSLMEQNALKPEAIDQATTDTAIDQLNCADFCHLIRRLSADSEIAEAILSKSFISAHSFHESALRRTMHAWSESAIDSGGMKVEYDLEADDRKCAMCQRRGEASASAEGRLLYCSNDEWVHVNCLLWSNEVFEEVDGALQNVFDALVRSRNSRCTLCRQKGATLNCCTRGCYKSFHFPCAMDDTRIVMLEDKRILCSEHANQGTENAQTQTNFEVSRCVYVDLETESKRVRPRPLKEIVIVIGSLHITSLGHLRTDVSSSEDLLIPVGFQCHRKYWSVKEPWKMTTYKFRTVYAPGSTDLGETQVNVTVSHEEDDVIMAESGLNLAELDTQDDRELIHMVLEDANFEQELEGRSAPSTAAIDSPQNDLRDSGFYSDGYSIEGTSPSPTDDHSINLEAWLADPEHAVILLDSALLASLEINPETSPVPLSVVENVEDEPSASSTVDRQLSGIATFANLPSNRRRKRRLTYSQWSKMRFKYRKAKSSSSTIPVSSRPASNGRPSNLDLNGNDAEWNRRNGNLVASIKVSPLDVDLTSVDSVHWKRLTSRNILQLDGAADSSENEEKKKGLHGKSSQQNENENEDEPVKCRRCRRSYKTWHSFNKHAEICIELLSSGGSSSSSNEDDDDFDARTIIRPKKEPINVSKQADLQKKSVTEKINKKSESDPIQVPIVNSSSVSYVPITSSDGSAQLKSTPPCTTTGKYVKPVVQRHRKLNWSEISRRPLAARIVNAPVSDSPSIRIPLPSPTTLLTLHSAPQPSPVLYTSNQLDLSGTIPTFPSLEQHPQIYIIPPPGQNLHSTPLVEATTLPTPTLSNIPQIATSPVVQYLGAGPLNLISTLALPSLTPLPTIIHGQSLYRWEAPTCGYFVYLQQQPQLLLSSLPTVVSVAPQNLVTMQTSNQAMYVAGAVPLRSANSEEMKRNMAANMDEPVAEPAVVTRETLIASCSHPNSSEDSRPTAEDSSIEVSDSSRNEASVIDAPSTEIEPDPSTDKDGTEGNISIKNVLSSAIADLANETFSQENVGGNSQAKEFDQAIDRRNDSLPHSLPLDVSALEDAEQDSTPFCWKNCLSVQDIGETADIGHAEEHSKYVGNSQNAIDISSNKSSTQVTSSLPSSVSLQSASENVLSSTRRDVASSKNVHEVHMEKSFHDTKQPMKTPRILYELVSDDGYYAKSESLSDIWKNLLDALQEARLANKLIPLSSFTFRNRWNLVGLNHNAVRYMLEQLPNVNRCSTYKFKYHKPRLEPDFDLTVSPFGCARSMPYSGRSRYDTFNWLASQHRIQPQPSHTFVITDIDVMQPVAARRATCSELQPISVRYKNLSQTVGQSVAVYRSNIHGRGLFSKRDIEVGEMIVEYSGEVIRPVLCDKREKEYEAKGMGCYMFRIDDHTVVDATMRGNCARFINHSCEPNCYSRIVDILGKKHIIIFALRRILRGEELTYDYKFPIEDVKIPCTCGSRKCRKFLN